MVFHILRIISWAAAGATLFTAVDVGFNGGAIVDFTVVCAFGVTACAFGILARIEQTSNLNNPENSAESDAAWKEYRENFLARAAERETRRASSASENTNSNVVCGNCGNEMQPDQNFCEQCGWQRINHAK